MFDVGTGNREDLCDILTNIEPMTESEEKKQSVYNPPEPHPLMEAFRGFVQKLDNRFEWLEEDIRRCKSLVASDKNPVAIIKPDAVRKIELRIQREHDQLANRIKRIEDVIGGLMNKFNADFAERLKKPVRKKTSRKKARR